jgi:carbon monoxide dehydrogenase subunit G
MTKLIKTINIDAPADKVFEFIIQPENLIEVWPSLVEANDIERLPNGGTKFNWKYKMAGMTFDGTSEDIEVIDGSQVVSKTEGGIPGTVTWTTEQEGLGTKVTFETEYTVPVPLLGKLAENLIVRANEREASTLLENMKDRLEG